MSISGIPQKSNCRLRTFLLKHYFLQDFQLLIKWFIRIVFSTTTIICNKEVLWLTKVGPLSFLITYLINKQAALVYCSLPICTTCSMSNATRYRSETIYDITLSSWMFFEKCSAADSKPWENEVIQVSNILARFKSN